jgi:hypothetical protein
MIKLNYSIEINATKEQVWKTMLDKKTYQIWAKAFSSGSTFIGEWKQGETMLFFDPDLGGTKAVFEIFNPHDEILAKHVSMVDKDMNENNEDEMSKKWIGSTERYSFIESGDCTKLEIEIITDDTFTEMFNTGWAKALKTIKSLSEK